MRAKTAKRRNGPGRVAILTYPQLSLFEFSAACEVFLADDAAPDEPWYDLVVCGAEPTVATQVGMTLTVPHGLSALRNADLVVLPPTYASKDVPDETIDAIRRAHARGARIASLCTGAFVLARTGLLDGRTAVTHWNDCDRFVDLYPTITLDRDVLYVDDGDILTSAGSAASIDLCLHIVRTDLGADAALRRARDMVVQPHRDGGQAQYIDTPIPTVATAEPLANTLAWMSEHLDEELTVADLAERTATSPRSFARHFAAATGSTPYQWLLRQRIQQAQRLLERSDLSVEQIASKVGLGNATNLRKHFRRQLSTSPQAYRRAFAGGSAA